MEAKRKGTGKKLVKILGATCLATGVVALGAAAAGAITGGAVAERFRAVKNMEK